ncbi:MAG: membrane protein insertase YidC [Bacteroidales bacterium]|nr:membrane protein insertase YidC [Bacteroidales bacterium]MBN2818825.1 membrane protein insertase YidC [Bacteroidales bacterium]
MDRNSILGIVIIAAIFIVFGVINKPSQEEQARIKRQQDSIATLRQQQEAEVNKQIKELEKTRAATDSLARINKAEKLGDFGQTVYGENEFYTIENDLLVLKVSKRGGRPYSVMLKEYRTYDSLPLVLFDGDSTVFGLNFYKQNHAISTNDLFFNVDSSYSEGIIVSDKPESLIMRLPSETGEYMEFVYTLSPGLYEVDVDINFVGMDGITGSMPNALDLQWEIFSPRHEKGWKNESNYTTLYYKPFNEDVDFFRAQGSKGPKEEDIPTKVEWIGYKGQFFASVIMSEKAFENARVQSINMPEEGKYIKQFKSEIGLPFVPETKTIPVKFYFGPNKFKLLKKQYDEKKLHDMVSVGRGIIKWINQGLIINLFNWLHKGIANYGLIILILTLIIKIMLLPLTFRSYISQAKMRVVKPMVDEATSKIPKDKAVERQQATMAIYKKVGVSPMGGCLPMVLQMPILFAMFRFFPTSIELRQQSFLWATDLSTYDSIFEWSQQIPILSNIYGNHISLFTILMTVTTLITMKTNSSAQMNDQGMPGMKTMMYIMPVTFMFVLNNFSAALTYYYFLANLITFGQNYLFKLFVNEDEVLKKLQAKKAKPKKKSKWQQRIEDMQKMQQQQIKKRR